MSEINSAAEAWIHERINDALLHAFDKVDGYQRAGYCTEFDVTIALGNRWGDAVQDLWFEYTSDGETI